MEIDYNELQGRIQNDLSLIQERLSLQSEVNDEISEYGYEVVFNANTLEEGFRSAFEAGRAIGELSGRADQLQDFLNFLYARKMEEEETDE